jgi:nitrate reductase gamma subunit
MTVEGEDESTQCFRDRIMNVLEIPMKYGLLVVFIRHDCAEVLGFWYGLTLGVGTQL